MLRPINENNRIIKTSKELTEYKSELKLAQNEVDYFLSVSQNLKGEMIGDSSKSLKVAEFDHELHHFKRLIKGLLEELDSLHHDQAVDAQNEAKLYSETFKDHQYYRVEMDDFATNFKELKYLFRAFVAQSNISLKKYDLNHISTEV
jgi:hypothetical protein